MTTTACSTLVERIHKDIGDWLSEDTTTNIAANTSVLSTALNKWDRGNDDHFNRWYLYITEGNNIGVERMISDYATATGTNTVYGGVLAAEAGAVTINWWRYSRTNTLIAINNAIREIYPELYRHIDDTTLIAGNWLPNAHFEKWSLTTVPDSYALTNATSAENNTAGNYRGATASVKVTASAANGYLYITSDTYPRLLDLMGKTIDFKCWVKPEVVNDATLVIYTLQADATAQTLTSTTTCPAGQYTS